MVKEVNVIVREEYEGASWVAGNILHLDLDSGYIGENICKYSVSCTLKYACIAAVMLHLNLKILL